MGRPQASLLSEAQNQALGSGLNWDEPEI